VKEKSQKRASAPRLVSAPAPNESAEVNSTPPDIDDPALLAAQARDGIEKSAADLRKQRVPISTEPPTVYRP
jgi:hypothetical protein